MRFEIVVPKMEAAFLALHGQECLVKNDDTTGEVLYTFRPGNHLKALQRRFTEDVDLQEFIEAYRRLEWNAGRRQANARRQRD